MNLFESIAELKRNYARARSALVYYLNGYDHANAEAINWIYSKECEIGHRMFLIAFKKEVLENLDKPKSLTFVLRDTLFSFLTHERLWFEALGETWATQKSLTDNFRQIPKYELNFEGRPSFAHTMRFHYFFHGRANAWAHDSGIKHSLLNELNSSAHFMTLHNGYLEEIKRLRDEVHIFFTSATGSDINIQTGSNLSEYDRNGNLSKDLNVLNEKPSGDSRQKLTQITHGLYYYYVSTVQPPEVEMLDPQNQSRLAAKLGWGDRTSGKSLHDDYLFFCDKTNRVNSANSKSSNNKHYKRFENAIKMLKQNGCINAAATAESEFLQFKNNIKDFL